MDHPRAHVPTFLYSDTCPLCEPTLIAVLPIFERLKQRLIIRKPTLAEMSVPGFSYPALVLPRGFHGIPHHAVLIGTGIAQAIRDVLESEKRLIDGHSQPVGVESQPAP